MSTRAKILAGVAALAVLVLALSGGDEPSARVQALEADPMATYVPPGGELVDTDTQNEGVSLGKPVRARYTRMFALPPGSSARALADARAAAEAAGWIQVGRTDAQVFAADKRVPSGRIELGVTVFRDSLLLPDDVQPPALLISLRHNGP